MKNLYVNLYEIKVNNVNSKGTIVHKIVREIVNFYKNLKDLIP